MIPLSYESVFTSRAAGDESEQPAGVSGSKPEAGRPAMRAGRSSQEVVEKAAGDRVDFPYFDLELSHLDRGR